MSKVAVNVHDNSCIMYELEINVSKLKNTKKYEVQQFFGLYGLYSFEEFGDYEFVDVSRVQRCVGFLKVEKCFYVIDKAN
ncbi:3711_t:CDS:2 [Cetraspora pellucida]|uniref:3711_t:CDS:1 n=1 Tax=Cetraspora pellucida TaxID=1433469 RepID=A0ACA9L8X0_9GLOM|nr:3711_t:CDS:2 [Cetraspora pellucida]